MGIKVLSNVRPVKGAFSLRGPARGGKKFAIDLTKVAGHLAFPRVAAGATLESKASDGLEVTIPTPSKPQKIVI
jgi:hypothetical protein